MTNKGIPEFPLFDRFLPKMDCPLFGVTTVYVYIQPLAKRQYYHYSTVSVENAVYFFGGFSSKEVNSVTRFIDDEWEQVFQLQTARHGHTTVMIHNQILQIGGEGNL